MSGEGAGAQPEPAGATALRTLLEAAPSAVLAVDGDGRITYVNQRLTTMFGYDNGELIGRQVEVLVPSSLAATHVRHRTAYAAHPSPRPMGLGMELAGRRKDGTEFPVEISLTTMPDGRGGSWTVAGLADITSRRETERRVQALSRAYLTLAQLNQAIIRAADEAELYAETCRVAVEQGGYLGAWIGVRGPGGTVRPVATAGALNAYISRLDIVVDPDDPRGRGPTAIALRESRFYYASDFLTDPVTTPWHAAARASGIRASATLPLDRDGETVAVLSLYSARPGVFDDAMRELLEQLAGNVSHALSGFAAAERVRQVAAQRSELLRRLVTAQESERARIAADVHDDTVQTLAAIDLRLGLLKGRLREVAPELEEPVTQIQSALSSATASLRQLLFELEPQEPGVGLDVVVREVAEHLLEGLPLTWSVRSDPDVRINDAVQAQAVRIVKEALINVRKHASAAHVDITLRAVDDGAEVTVSDDGVGLEADRPLRRPGHRGLETMRDRAAVAGGWLRLERNDRGGTTVRFWVPDDVQKSYG